MLSHTAAPHSAGNFLDAADDLVGKLAGDRPVGGFETGDSIYNVLYNPDKMQTDSLRRSAAVQNRCYIQLVYVLIHHI